jgi:hypothetical protein
MRKFLNTLVDRLGKDDEAFLRLNADARVVAADGAEYKWTRAKNLELEGAGGVCSKRCVVPPSGPLKLKADLGRHRPAMLVVEMAVGSHCQNAAIAMSKPAANRRNIDAALDAPGCVQMAQIMTGKPMHATLATCRSQRLLTLDNR